MLVPPYVLGVFALSLAGAIALELWPAAAEEGPAATAMAPAIAMVPPPPRPPASADGRSAEWMATAAARPLFSPVRRPPSPSMPSVAATPFPRLAGTLIGPFGKRALMVDSNTDKSFTLDESDQLGIWTVEEISAGAVTLRSPEGTQSLRVGFREPSQPDKGVRVSGAAPRIRKHNRT